MSFRCRAVRLSDETATSTSLMTAPAFAVGLPGVSQSGCPASFVAASSLASLSPSGPFFFRFALAFQFALAVSSSRLRALPGSLSKEGRAGKPVKEEARENDVSDGLGAIPRTREGREG